MEDFDNIVEKASEFPSSDGRFLALQSYVENLGEFINITCDQTEVRLKARTIKEQDPVSQVELESDINYMRDTGKHEFSATICGAVLVSIYFAYEASLISIFEHLAKNKGLVKFDTYKKKQSKRIRAKHNGSLSFLILAEQYVEEILKINLFAGNSDSVPIEELRIFRNSYVHKGCFLDDLTETTKIKVMNGTYRHIIGFNDTRWFITPKGVNIFYSKTYELFKYFQRQAFTNAIT